MAIQSNGKIVVAGGASGKFAVARYNTDRTLDTTFSSNGKVTTNFSSGFDTAFELAIQPSDDRIVAAGTAEGADFRFALARYASDGSLDTTFGSNGKVRTNFTPGFDSAFDLGIQPSDEKIVAAGTAGGGGGNVFALARYETDGTLDSTFTGDGKAITSFGPGVEHVDGGPSSLPTRRSWPQGTHR